MADKEGVRTEEAPAPFQGAPYSQAIRANGLVFVSGQLALKPGDSAIGVSSIEEQTEQVFANLRAILEAAGSSL
jgi:2-iminobutanoate/2-iminopropanoate deaminase